MIFGSYFVVKRDKKHHKKRSLSKMRFTFPDVAVKYENNE